MRALSPDLFQRKKQSCRSSAGRREFKGLAVLVGRRKLSKLPLRGFVRQDGVPLAAILATRAGSGLASESRGAEAAKGAYQDT